MTDDQGYYTDPSLVHLNIGVLKDKMRLLEIRVGHLERLLVSMGNQLIESSNNLRDLTSRIFQVLKEMNRAETSDGSSSLCPPGGNSNQPSDGTGGST